MPSSPHNQADTPKAPKEEGVEPGVPDGLLGRLARFARGFGRRLVNFAINFAAVAIVSIVFLALVNVSPDESDLHAFQDRLIHSVEDINPANLIDHTFNRFAEDFAAPVRSASDHALGSIYGFIERIEAVFDIDPHGGIDLALRILALPALLIVVVLEFGLIAAILALALALSPIIVPIAVFAKGSLLEGMLVILVFFPLMRLVVRLVSDKELTLKMRAGLWLCGVAFALVLMTLFYLFLKWTMWGALWAFGEFIPLAPSGVAASGIAVFGYECAKKTVEGSITERLAGFVRRLVGA